MKTPKEMREYLKQLERKKEKELNLPSGLITSLRVQEGGDRDDFLMQPDKFHYKPGADGKKPKTTARGLYGTLEGTARDPGYNVKPLADWSPEAQVNFAGAYVAGRAKSAGGLKAGLAGYGEGNKYADSVLSRVNNWEATPLQAAAPREQRVPEQVAAMTVAAGNQGAIPRFGEGLNTRLGELNAMLNTQNQSSIPQDYAKAVVPQSNYENPFWKNFKQLTGIM